MEDLYKRKLWHQLTCVLEAFMVLPAAASHLVPLFETFVKDFKHKLNKMALARIQIAMAHQMKDVDEVTAFCQAAAEDADAVKMASRAAVGVRVVRAQAVAPPRAVAPQRSALYVARQFKRGPSEYLRVCLLCGA